MDLGDFNLGNFECHLFFNDFFPLEKIIAKIEKENFENVFCSGIHIEDYNLIYLNSIHELLNLGINYVKQIKFETHSEGIMVQNFGSKFLLSHYFNLDSKINMIQEEGFIKIIKFYFSKIKNAKLIIGFELSFDLVSFETSLNESVNDESLYPIYVIEKSLDSVNMERYTSDMEQLGFDLSIMDKYLKTICDK